MTRAFSRRKGLHRVGISSTQQAIAKLDRAFSTMIRARDEGKPCIACGKTHREWDAGHYRRRELMSTRFNYQNVNAEGKGCNRGTHNNKYGMKDMDLYRENLDKRWGRGTAQRLYKLSQQLRQWDERDLNVLTDAARRGFAVYRQVYDELVAS
jgi:hypothetical protein